MAQTWHTDTTGWLGWGVYNGATPQASCNALGSAIGATFGGTYTSSPTNLISGGSSWSLSSMECYLFNGSEPEYAHLTMTVTGTADVPPDPPPEGYSATAVVLALLLAWAIGYVLGFKVRMIRSALNAA